MPTSENDNRGGLSKEQIDLIQQFEADYNAVDHSLRDALGADEQVSFSQLLIRYAKEHARWRDAEVLKTIAGIRNAIVHGKTKPYRYVVIPTPAIAEELKRCRERLVNPALAIPTFQRPVETISTGDSLARVLKIIDERDYSQFPVYEGQQFRGLLTENGVTRWLARHVTRTLSLVELDEIPVVQVLQNEEKRQNHQFVSRNMLVDDVRVLFAKHALLEAALITNSGKQAEKLLGIATRWDILHLA